MSSSDTSFIQPTSGLVTKVTNPKTKQIDYAFPLQTSAWLKMQTVIRTALAFPITKDTFTDLYGTFTDEQTLLQAIAILKTINTTAQEYGDPTTLISNISKFQKASTAPDSIYGNAVWLAYNTQTTAEQIRALLNQGLQDIGEEPDPATRIKDLTELLTGKGGITDQANTLKTQIENFSKKVSSFYTTLNGELNGPSNSLASYLDQSGNILSDAEADVQADKDAIKQLNKTIKKLNDEYIGFTVAASASPLFLLVPFVGPFLAVADAATFAVLAVKVKKEMDADKKTLAKEEKDKQQKAALVSQLHGFNASALDVETDGKAFLDALGKMIGGWTEFDVQIKKRLSSLTVEDVKDWNAFLTKINFQAALHGWTLIGSKAETFASAGFISFSPQTS